MLRRRASTPSQLAEGLQSTTAAVPTGSETPSISISNDALAEQRADSSLALPLPQARARDIVYTGPIAEDAERGGAAVAPVVTRMWTNISGHVRDSFNTPATVDEAPKSTPPMLMDNVMVQSKALAASFGLGPSHWSRDFRGSLTAYYNGKLPLAPYKKGQTAAYNYTMQLVPREMAFRVPMDMYVDPVYATSDRENKWKMMSQPLFNFVRGKTTLLCIFSNQPLSGFFTGLRHWTRLVGDDFLALPNTQALKLHAAEGWFSRRSHILTKFYLRKQVSEEEMFKTFVYKGKWKWEYVEALHLYDADLPVMLLLDSLGYVRWHAVGLPTEEATGVFKDVSRKLARAAKSHL